MRSYSKDGAMRVQNATDPVYAPNSYGGPKAEPNRTDDGGHWYSDGEMVRAAYTLHSEDDDWGQPGTLVREVLDDAARERLVNNIVGHLLYGVSGPVLDRAFQYWRNVLELHRETARVAPRVRAAPPTRDGREPDDHLGPSARLKHRRPGEGAHILHDLERPERTTAVRVRLAFRNALAVEIRHLLDQVVILQQQRAVRPDRQRLLIACDGHASVGGGWPRFLCGHAGSESSHCSARGGAEQVSREALRK